MTAAGNLNLDGLGFRVWSLGFTVYGDHIGRDIQGCSYKVQDLGFALAQT